MSKRFTDSKKWDDDWFLELEPHYKLFWIYVLDKCDHAGFFKPNLKLASFCVGYQFNSSDTLKVFKGRIALRDCKWYLPKFVSFQYGELKATNNTHISILNKLRRAGVAEGLVSPYRSPYAGEKEKEKEKEKDKDKDIYGDYVLLKKIEYTQLIEWYGKGIVTQYIERLNNYIGSKGKRYKSHYYTILAWLNKDNVKKRQAASKVERVDPKERAKVSDLIHQTVKGMRK